MRFLVGLGIVSLIISVMDPTVVAAAVVTVISALVIGVVTVINAIAAAADRKDARTSRVALAVTTEATSKKADTIIDKAVEIHTLTNSNLSLVTKNLEVALQKVEGLQKLVESLVTAKVIADKIADKVVDRAAPAAAPAAQTQLVGGAVVERLERIDESTAATAKNTEKTDAAVQALKDK